MKKLFILSTLVLILFIIMSDKNENKTDLINNATLFQNLKNQSYNIQNLQAEKMVTKLNKEISINLLEEVGFITIEHDKTPENNWWTEWLNNSEILVNSKYKVSVSINTNDINLKNINGVIYADINMNDFYINAVELFETVTVEERKIFGKRYDTSDVLALESELRKNIYSEILNDENLNVCLLNLTTYLENMASLFNVPIIISSK